MTHDTGRATSADSSGVASRDDFADFMKAVLYDYSAGGEAEWENGTLGRFLDALSAFAGARLLDHDDQETATWRLFAEMIVAATGYE